MAKFSGGAAASSAPRAPIQATVPTRTYEGGGAWELDPKGELFLLAAVNMVGEDTFYEKAKDRDQRFVRLIGEVTQADAKWMQGFAPYLRSELKMRSASAVLACEYVRAGGPEGRKIVDAVCQRADEPAEVLGYWLSTYGRNVPMAIKRGVADAVRRLYTQYNVLKWDSSRRSLSFADVIELTHPTPRDDAQSTLFKYLLDEAHHDDGHADVELMGVIAEDLRVLSIPEDERRATLAEDGIPDFWAWERIAGWLPGGMDAAGWEAAIPNMGVMALIRNLRNFDGKGISNAAIDEVIAKITDQEGVEKSRIFPYQVWTAYREAPSDNWRRALGTTLELSMPNTPDLGPGTLVLIDTSSSMTQTTMSGRSTVVPLEVAAVMATALAFKRRDTDIGIFADGYAQIDVTPGASALRVVEAIRGSMGIVGHSTFINKAINGLWNPDKHKRVIVFTDCQAHDSAAAVAHVPKIYHFDLGGYGKSNLEAGKSGRYVFGGFSDATFTGIAALESVGHTGWPFA
jgi:hypothetical protein